MQYLKLELPMMTGKRKVDSYPVNEAPLCKRGRTDVADTNSEDYQLLMSIDCLFHDYRTACELTTVELTRLLPLVRKGREKGDFEELLLDGMDLVFSLDDVLMAA